MDARIKQILTEGSCIVRKVEKSVDQENADRYHIPSPFDAQGRPHNVKDSFERTTKTIKLLRYIRQSFSQTTNAWDRFTAIDGDIGYLSDSSEASLRHLHSIRESFQGLADLEIKMNHLERSCREDSCKILELRMSLESNRLQFESHRLNFESIELNRQTSALQQEIYQTSQDAARVALGNHRMAFLGIMMNSIFLPVGIAVGLFGSQEDIFHFNRTPKSFTICVLAMITGVGLLILMVTIADRYSWLKKCGEWIHKHRFPQEPHNIIEMEEQARIAH